MKTVQMRATACAIALSAVAGYSANAQLFPNPTLTTQGAGLSVAIGGVGLSDVRNGDLSVNVGGAVQAAYLYWNGDGLFPGPQELNFGGTLFAGSQIGMEFAGAFVLGYRADVTAAVQAEFGSNGPGVLTFNVNDPSPIDNLDRMHGAGLLVVYSDPNDPTEYRLITFDGLDYAWSGLAGANAVTQPITFTFDAIGADRSAELFVMVGECSASRPDAITVSSNPTINSALNGSDGDEWDSDTFAISIASGASSATVEVVSPAGDINSDSLVWQVGALRIPLDKPQTGGGQGCTPGYWKQPHHFDSWTAPYSPNMLFSDVFEDAYPGKTLLQVLKLTGNKTGLEALGRHTVAALLNGASAGVDYDLTAQDVIDLFNDAFPGTKPGYNSLKNLFQGYNEQGCPLN